MKEPFKDGVLILIGLATEITSSSITSIVFFLVASLVLAKSIALVFEESSWLCMAILVLARLLSSFIVASRSALPVYTYLFSF